MEAGPRSGGAEDGVRALRWTPGLSSCREETTGLEGSEEYPLGATGRGSWVGFLGNGCDPCTVFFWAAAAHFLGKVGVHAGEGAWDRQVGLVGVGLQTGTEEDEEDEDEEEEEEEEDASLLTAESGSMSGGGGGAALAW